jgi:hypothetical protein
MRYADKIEETKKPPTAQSINPDSIGDLLDFDAKYTDATPSAGIDATLDASENVSILFDGLRDPKRTSHELSLTKITFNNTFPYRGRPSRRAYSM